ncbi:MAG: hypothetical protein HY863_19735 [Chloroflexi bacterium]|nr:hypothetical protein [Chloroflexota bacterium]
MNIVYLDFRPFSHFVRNGFRQRAGRILYHLIRSDRVARLVYVWWNEDSFSSSQDELPSDVEYKEMILHEARRAPLPFARRLGLVGGWVDKPRIQKAVAACRELSGSYWVWATDPRLAVPARELANRLNGKLCVDLIDNFAVRFEGAQEKLFRKAYEDTSRLADKIVANTPEMQSYLNIPDTKFKCVLNGVDWQVFHNGIHLREPSDITNIPRPRVGFVGTLTSLNDINLLNVVAKEIPECSVVVVGPIREEDKPLDPRIHSLGMKSYIEVPSYISSFDICISVYRKHPAVLYIDSQKIKEYLAAGKLVVSSHSSNISPESAYVSVANNVDEFVCMVRDAIEKTADASLRDRISLSVADQDWQKRISEILDFLEEDNA